MLTEGCTVIFNKTGVIVYVQSVEDTSEGKIVTLTNMKDEFLYFEDELKRADTTTLPFRAVYLCPERAKDLSYGDTVHHKSYRNADGSPSRARVNGKVKTWKTRPDEFRVPMKYGLRNYFYMTQDSADEWLVEEK